MAENRLNIINIVDPEESLTQNSPYLSSRNGRMKEMQAKFERLWLQSPEKFDPLRNCMEKERLDRTSVLLKRHTGLKDKHAADIGCGGGVFSRHLRDAGAAVVAVDIAENALKQLQREDFSNITPKQDAMPVTSLPDHAFDVVVCTELIAYLNRDDYRLFFAELSRLVRPDGYIVCSSPIDIYTDGGVEKLIELAQTEFDPIDAIASYHALYLRLERFLEAPSRYVHGWESSDFKRKEMSQRKGLGRWWFWANSSPVFVWLWYGIEPLTRPIRKHLKNSSSTLLRLEKICRFIWDEAGVSHYIFIAKRRPLKVVDPKEIPVEHPKRKEIWE